MSDKSIMNIFKSNRTFPQRIKLTVSLKKNSHFWNQNAGCFTQKKKKKKNYRNCLKLVPVITF